MAERLQKVLANQGFGSRRAIESMIEAGRIYVNGKPAKLGDKVSSNERITIDKKLIKLEAASKQTIIYHKPVGEVCTTKPEPGQTSIYQSLPKPTSGKWLSVGRLDLNTSGLLIMTTDGELLQKMQHPSYGNEREYKVRAYGQLTEQVLKDLKSKMQLDDGLAQFLSIKYESSRGDNHWFKVVLGEGRHRLVRRMFEQAGLTVNRLIRIRFGNTCLPYDLKPGRIKSIIL